MRCQFGLVDCNNEAEYQNRNGVRVCLTHKLLLDAFNWETRKVHKWIRIKEAKDGQGDTKENIT